MQLINYAYPLIIVGVVNFALSLIIFFNGYKNKVNISFSLFTFSVGLWSLGLGLYSLSSDLTFALISAKIYYTGAILIALFFFHFSLVYPEQKTKSILLHRVSSIIILTYLSLLLLKRDFLTREIVTRSWGNEVILGNTEYFLYSILFLTFFCFGLYILWKSYSNSEGTQKRVLFYIFISVFSASIFGITFNLILPWLGNYWLIWVGPLFSIIVVLIIFYSIITYHIFNTRLLIGKTIYFILVAIPPYFTYFALAFIYESIFGTSFNTVAYIVGIPVAITFTAFLNFFTKFISEYTDTHLINPGYNPLVVLEQHRQRLSNTLDIEKIIQESLFIIARTIRPSNSGVILIGKKNEADWSSVNYKKSPYENPREFKTFTEYFLRHREKAINYDILVHAEIQEDTVLMQNKHLSSQMEKHDLGVIVVLKEEETIRGILVVGRKEADQPYNNQEIKFLVSIADSMSLALGRALLYKEVQLFNEELQQKINEATATLQKKNKDLEEALAQLKEIRRQEKDMLDVMGHELRTPISIARNSVMALQKAIDENRVSPEKLAKYNHMAVESIRKEIALIETFLSTTKLEGGRMQMNLEPISLKKVIKDSINAHMEFSQKNNTQVVYNEPEADIIVSADKVRIQEIMDNFLNNAIKYTGKGNVEISMYAQEGLGWIDVKDDGIGISPEDIENLGKKFFRAKALYDESNKGINPSGTGLGLFVSFQLIDLMKGKKKIVSQKGVGSTFSFGLPLLNQ